MGIYNVVSQKALFLSVPLSLRALKHVKVISCDKSVVRSGATSRALPAMTHCTVLMYSCVFRFPSPLQRAALFIFHVTCVT